ncbi:Glutamate-gated chloride channel [Camponotus floridanus]|uniref:Glutamate-gated chloride channel n=1 Tax=Camponotus floridanus TaxID=104421 RepID=E2AR57_CAMFO|nr:Glutamate-gated chloride channel [Camponotus floridanus]
MLGANLVPCLQAGAMWPGVLPLLVLLAVLLHPSRCTQTQVKVNFREKEKQVLDNILGPGRYDARIRPSGENGTGLMLDTSPSEHRLEEQDLTGRNSAMADYRTPRSIAHS